MKRAFLAITGIVMCLFCFIACEPATELSVGQSSLAFDNAGGSQSVTLLANKAWTTSASQSWCKVTPASGDGSSAISISCDPNSDYDSRSCTVTVACAELTATIAVSQAEGAGLVLSQTEFTLDNTEQTVSFEVMANVDYLVSVDGAATSWIKVQSTKGLSPGKVVLAVSANKEYDRRTGTVTVRDVSGSLSRTVTVTQGESYGLFIDEPTYNISNEKQTLTVAVKANVEFEVVSQAGWIRYVETKGLKSSQIVLEIDANETYDVREGQVVVRQKDGGLSGTITVRQDETYGLFVTKTAYEVTSAEQTIDIEVKYNVRLDVVIPDECKDWIVLLGTKGLRTRNYTFRIKRNAEFEPRSGSVTFKQEDGPLSGTVSIVQAEAQGLEIPKKEFTISSQEQDLDVEVRHNGELEVTVGSDCNDWIQYVETKGLSTENCTFHIAKNTTSKERKGSVVIKVKDGLLSGKVIIKQSPKGNIVVDPSEYEVDWQEQSLRIPVKTNVPFEVSMEEQDWMSLDSIRGVVPDMTLVLSIKENQKEGRQAKIVLYVENEDRKEVTVKQGSGFLSFDDVMFEAYCVKEFDENGDGKVSCAEAAKAEAIKCDSLGIVSLKGIEGFVNITSLNCRKNALLDLDLSKNGKLATLVCDGNALTELDLTGNSDLRRLVVSGNQLRHLYVFNSPLLTELYAEDNRLGSLDLSKNVLLSRLNVRDNLLTSLVIRDNALLESVDAGYNGLRHIHLLENRLLNDLAIDHNKIEDIDVSNNTRLRTLDCSWNEMTALEIANLPLLESVDCSHNKITDLSVTEGAKLLSLDCSHNKLDSELTIADCPLLETLSCHDTDIEGIDLSGLEALRHVFLKPNAKLKCIWLKTGQKIEEFEYDKSVEVKYK